MNRTDHDPRTLKLAADAERLQRDTRLDAWRTPGRRRGLVLATLAVLAGVAALAWFDRSVALLVAIAVAAGLYVLLRRVVRGMADLPDAFVDERVRAVLHARSGGLNGTRHQRRRTTKWSQASARTATVTHRAAR